MRSCAEILTRRCFVEILRGDLATESDLVQKALVEVLYYNRGLVQKSCQEVSYRDLANKALYRERAQRSLQEILPRDLL